MLNGSPSRQIAEIWSLRNSGQANSAYPRWLALSARARLNRKLPPPERLRALLQQGWSREDSIEFLLQEASFLRAQRKIEESNELLHAIAESSDGEILPFQYHFQKGLNALIGSLYSVALDEFLTSQGLAATQGDRLLAGFNTLLCYEALGLPIGNGLSEIRREMEERGIREEDASLREQIVALELRVLLRNGRLTELFRRAEEISAKDMGEQSLYLLAWLQKLPYISPARGTRDYLAALVDKTSAQGSFGLGTYRLRTLQGLLIDRDLLEEIKICDQIDRLYLWVWDWLIQPTPDKLEKLTLVQAAILKKLDQEELPSDAYQLLENACAWVALFGTTQLDSLRAALRKTRRQGPSVNPVFQYESLFIEYCFALRDEKITASDTASVLKQHPAASIPGFSADVFARFACSEKTTNSKIEVRVREGQVILQGRSGGAKTIRNSSVAQLLTLFESRSAVNRSEVGLFCFGLRKYDPVLHDQRLANFLSKTNALLSRNIRFTIRDERVHLEGSRHLIGIACNSQHCLSLSINPQFIRGLFERPGSGTRVLKALTLEPASWHSRKDIEDHLQVSRATANRLITKWLSQGLLEKKGAGKNSIYQLSTKLAAQLARGNARGDV